MRPLEEQQIGACGFEEEGLKNGKYQVKVTSFPKNYTGNVVIWHFAIDENKETNELVKTAGLNASTMSITCNSTSTCSHFKHLAIMITKKVVIVTRMTSLAQIFDEDFVKVP